MSFTNVRQDEKPHIIYTDRLILRLADPRVDTDCERILHAYLDAESTLRGQGKLGMTTIDDVRYRHELLGPKQEICKLAPPPKGMNFLVFLREQDDAEGDFVAMISFCCRREMPYPDLGWATLEPYRRRGYATEAARAALKFWTEKIGVKEVCAVTLDSSEQSIRLAEKIGLVKAGTIDAVFGTPPNEKKVLGRGLVLPGMVWRDGLSFRPAIVRPEGWRWKTS